jgi:hypothetical protein
MSVLICPVLMVSVVDGTVADVPWHDPTAVGILGLAFKKPSYYIASGA